MRDVLLGALGYWLMAMVVIGFGIAWWWLVGPPISDRARSFAFNAGGGILAVASVGFLVALAILYDIITHH